MPSVDRQTVLIVGLGLIGGSIARALADKPSYRVLACGRNDRPLRQAQADGVIEHWSHDVAELAPQSDIVVVATPTRSVARIFSVLADCVNRNTIITDAASVKGSVVADARRYFADSMNRIVPAHPIAGSEKTGYAASRADLYTGRNVIVTPDLGTSTPALRRVVELWQQQGADVHLMSAERHDEILAGTSHLPHLLAFDLVNTLTESVSEPDRPWQVFDFAAGGFADFSRIASSDATMWRDIFLSNSQATAALLDRYIERLQKTRDSMLMHEGDVLHDAFSRAKATRDDFIASFNARRHRAECGNQTQRPVDQHANKVGAERGLPRELAWKHAAVSGECRLSANYSTVQKAIADAAEQNQVTVLHGCPDNRELRDFIQCQVDSGVLIAGPDNGRIIVYAGDSGEVVDQELPADPVVIALLALLLGNDSTYAQDRLGIRVKSAVPDGAAIPQLLTVLQGQGVIALQHEGGDLCLSPVAGAACSPAGDVTPGIVEKLCDEDLLLAVVAMLWRKETVEPLKITLASQRVRVLWDRLQPLQGLGVLVCPDLSESVVKNKGTVQLVLHRPDRLPEQVSFAAGHDEWLALSVMAAIAPLVPAGLIGESGDIRASYPGFIQLLDSLGMDIREQPQQSKE